MAPFFEYIDTLVTPYEAFLFDSGENFSPTPPHWHYFMELIYVTRGSACAVSGEKRCALEQGDLFVFHPQTVHAITLSKSAPVCYYVLKFDPLHINVPGSTLPALSDMLYMIRKNPGLPVHFPGRMLDNPAIGKLFEDACRTIEKKEFGYDIQMHSYCTLLVTELLRLWVKDGFQLTPGKRETSQEERFAAVGEFIFQNCQKPVSVKEIAASFHMSYSHFAMRFKNYYGQSCAHFIKMARIQKAEDLLRFTDFDLTYISQETGFSDSSHFIRVFKEFHHRTPGQFRAEYRRK